MKAIKLLLILIILTVAAYFAAVWYSGNQIQKNYEEKIARFSEQLKNNFPEIKITQQSYEKSFFSAKSVLTVEVKEKPSVLLFRGWCSFVDKPALELLPDSQYIRQTHDMCTEFQAGKTFAEATYPMLHGGELSGEEALYFKYHITNDITHGPWLGSKGMGMASIQSKVSVEADHLPAGMKDYIDSLQIETVKSFSNDYDTHIVGNKIEELLVFEDSVRLGFDGFDLHLVTSDKRMKMDTRLTMPRFYYELVQPLEDIGPHRVEVTDVVNSSSGLGPDAPFNLFSNGRSAVSIGRVEVTLPSLEGKWVRCENLKGETENALKDKLVSSDQKFVTQCSTNLLAPDLNVAVDVVYKLKNINGDSFIKLGKAYIQTVVKAIEAESGDRYVSRDEVVMQFLKTIEENLPDFVAPGPEMFSEYTVSVNNHKDIFKMTSEIKFKPLTEEEKSMAWYLMLPSKLSAKITYSVSADVFENGLPEYDIEPLSGFANEIENKSKFEKPLIIKDGERYKLIYGYDGGNIILGEERISLTDLFK